MVGVNILDLAAIVGIVVQAGLEVETQLTNKLVGRSGIDAKGELHPVAGKIALSLHGGHR